MLDSGTFEKLGFEPVQPDWPAPVNVRAFSTTRSHGFSQGAWSSLNLGGSCGDNPVHVKKNREVLRTLLPGDPRWLRQVHGKHVVSWDDAAKPEIKADAIFSVQPGQVCAVLTADCLPVLFCDRAGTTVAAAHAGWRGLAGGVLEATVRAMGCAPSELMAWMGPAIGPDAFEVGQDVYDSFVSFRPENAFAFKVYRDRWLADLYGLARSLLFEAGVSQVYGGQHCTFNESEKFFSYRRDQITGRMANVIWLET
jgi:YfiH family protein